MKKSRKIVRARRTSESKIITSSDLHIGDEFKYKGFLCTIDALSKNTVIFHGVKKESTGAYEKNMFLNIESFRSGIEENRITMASTQ